MRLIDADKIGEVSADPYEEGAFQDEIKSQPTVKAIPIEWIRNVWLKRPDNQGEVEFFPPATFEVIMNWLIDDWEKDNASITD